MSVLIKIVFLNLDACFITATDLFVNMRAGVVSNHLEYFRFNTSRLRTTLSVSGSSQKHNGSYTYFYKQDGMAIGFISFKTNILILITRITIINKIRTSSTIFFWSAETV